MFRKVIDYLSLRHVGGIELFFATLPILSAYNLMGIPLQVILWGGLFVLLIFSPKKREVPILKSFAILAAFVLVHDFIYLFIARGNLNAYIMQIFYFGCIFMTVKTFNIEKLKGSLNFVAIISMIGLIYQWSIIAAGESVHPIQIPFLNMEEIRLDAVSARPSSFFMEPAAYVAFMYLPLAFSLIDKKFIWTAIIIFSDFLTTSTTGILTSFIMLIVYIFTQDVSIKIKLLTITIGVVIFYTLTNIEVFQAGVDKLKNTDIEANVRLIQGPYIVSTMSPFEMIAGATYNSAYDYCFDGRAPYVVVKENQVFISTVWMLILKYGFVGLFLYLFFYYKIGKGSRKTIPLIICLVATMFSSGFGIGINYVYTSAGLLLMYGSQSHA